MNLRAIACAAIVAFAGASAQAQEDPIAAARRDGAVNWYTTQIVDQIAAPAAKAFQAKYGIPVNYVRADPNSLVLRIWNESKAGRVAADVFDGAPTVSGLRKVDLVQPWVPEGTKRLAPQYFDPKGYWTASNIYVLTPAYNTNLIAKGTEPKTLDDLFDAKLKDRMAWAAGTFSAPGFIGLSLAHFGEQKGMDYLRRLAGQRVRNLNVSAREVVDQVIAGEYAIGLSTFNYHSVISAAKGAPVAWIPMSPALGYFSVIGLVKGAPHVNAGKLFIEYLISPEAQKLFRDADYIPVDPDTPPRDAALRPDGKTFDAIWFSPEEIDEKLQSWNKILKDVFQ